MVPKVLHNNMVPLCPRFHFFKTRLGQTNKQQTHKGWGGFLWRVKNKRRRCLSFLRSTMGCGEAAFWGRAKSRCVSGRKGCLYKKTKTTQKDKNVSTPARRKKGKKRKREKGEKTGELRELRKGRRRRLGPPIIWSRIDDDVALWVCFFVRPHVCG